MGWILIAEVWDTRVSILSLLNIKLISSNKILVSETNSVTTDPELIQPSCTKAQLSHMKTWWIHLAIQVTHTEFHDSVGDVVSISTTRLSNGSHTDGSQLIQKPKTKIKPYPY